MKITLNKRKKSVISSNSGYTLTEAIIGLGAFCLLASLFPLFYQTLQSEEQINKRLQAMQWEVFTKQIQKEIRMSHQIDPQTNRLFLSRDTNTILYEQSGTNLRRRVNFTGNEILLQNVKSVKFNYVKNGVGIEIEDLWGARYRFTTIVYINISQL